MPKKDWWTSERKGNCFSMSPISILMSLRANVKSQVEKIPKEKKINNMKSKWGYEHSIR